MNEDAVQELIHRKPELKPARAKLEAMQPGTYCIHRSWGFGRITGYDPTDAKLIIDFEQKPDHRMDPAFCVSTLELLAPGHILVRKQTEPDVIEEMIDKRPADLVVDLLQQYPNNAATAVEVESVLVRVVGEAGFKRWWLRARKELARDPRVASPVKKTECYVVRNEPVSQEDEILEQFKGTRSARRRIGLAEKLLHAAADKENLKESLGHVLEDLSGAVRDSRQLTPSERLHGAWVRDDLAKLLGDDASTIEPSVASLVAEPRDLPDIAEALSSHLQTRLLDLVHEAHPAEWKDIVFNLLKTSQGKFTTDCISFLIEHDCGKELPTTLARWQTEQNLRAPVLLWIVKNRNSKRFRSIVSDLIGPRLLGSIFFAIDYEALQTAGSRQIPLAEELSEDQDLINDLLAASDAETARDLANTLLLNQGFEELTKKSLLARFIKQFPNIQSLVSDDTEEKEERLLVSRESFDRKAAELNEIIQKKIPENSRSIAAAREHGDLRENAEYKMAKQDQSILFAQRGQIEHEIARAQVTDFSSATKDHVGVGSVVLLQDPKSGREAVFTILGAWDGDPERHIISYKTPLGASLMAHRVGDTVAVNLGDVHADMQLKEIKRYIDDASD